MTQFALPVKWKTFHLINLAFSWNLIFNLEIKCIYWTMVAKIMNLIRKSLHYFTFAETVQHNCCWVGISHRILTNIVNVFAKL